MITYLVHQKSKCTGVKLLRYSNIFIGLFLTNLVSNRKFTHVVGQPLHLSAFLVETMDWWLIFIKD